MNVSAEKLARSNKPKELIGRRLFDFIHPFDRDRTIAGINEVLQNDAHSPFIEQKIICCDGEYIDVEASSIRIHNFNGKMVVLSVLRDLTERKNSQEILVKSEKLL